MPEFEVASIKPSEPGVRTSNVLLGARESLTIENVPLRKIILYAYDIRDFQLADGPGWLEVARYDILAKTAAAKGAFPEPAAETDDQRKARIARVWERLRTLLSDRFALRVRFEQREHTVLHLRISKNGPKLAEAAPKTEKDAGRISTIDGRIQGFAAPIPLLATQLSMATGLIVDDQTGLRGHYDFVLDWAPGDTDPSDTRPSIFTAVTEQLGLRMERAKGPVKTVVIDRVDRPSAN